MLNVVANRLRVERHVRQGLQLFSSEDAQVVPAPQKHERRELIEYIGSFNGGSYKGEEHDKQREPPAHHLEQVIEDDRQRYIAQEYDDVDRDARPIEQLVPQDVVRRSCRIARHNNRGRYEANGEEAPDNDDQVQAWPGAAATLLQSVPSL